MAGQFELSSTHNDNKNQSYAVITEVNSGDAVETAKALLERSYGLIPSDKAAYNDYLGLAVSLEEIAKVAPATASIIIDQVLAQEVLDDKYNQGSIYAVLCSEPGNSSISNMKTKAKKEGANWTLSGIKLITKEQQSADVFLVFATDEEGNTRVFEAAKELVKAKKVNKTIAGTNIELNQADISMILPESAEVSVVGSNYERNLAIGRTLVAAVAIGIGHSALVTSISTAKEAKDAENHSILNTQSLQFTLTDIYAEIEAGRSLTYLSANLIDSNKASIKFATMAKVQSSDAAANASIQSLQVLGNLGFLANNDFAAVIEHAVGTQIKGGTNRVQKNQIYQYILAKK